LETTLFISILLLAGLQSISAELYEATPLMEQPWQKPVNYATAADPKF